MKKYKINFRLPLPPPPPPLTLPQATKLKKITQVKDLIQAGVSPNIPDALGLFPLHYAAVNDDLVITTHLVKTGKADITALDKEGRSALHHAVAGECFEVARFLIKEANRQKINLVEVGEHHYLPVHCAAREGKAGMLKLLIEEFGAEPLPLYKGLTPLQIAVSHGHLNCVQFYHEYKKKKIDLNALDSKRNTLLHGAALTGDVGMATFLVETVNQSSLQYIKYLNGEGQSAPHVAAAMGHIPLMEYFFSQLKETEFRNGLGQSYLHIAANFGKYAMSKWLVDVKEMDPNILDRNYNTPINIAAMCGHLHVVKLFTSGLCTGLCIRNQDGAGPVELAALGNYHHIVQWLLRERHADVRQKLVNDLAKTTSASNKTERGLKDDVEKVEALLSKKKEMKQEELEQQDQAFITAAEKEELKQVKKLLLEGVLVDNVRSDGSTALHVAAENGHMMVVVFLVGTAKVTTVLVDEQQRTVLQRAILGGVVRPDGNLEMVQYLVDHVFKISPAGYQDLINETRELQIHNPRVNQFYQEAMQYAGRYQALVTDEKQIEKRVERNKKGKQRKKQRQLQALEDYYAEDDTPLLFPLDKKYFPLSLPDIVVGGVVIPRDTARSEEKEEKRVFRKPTPLRAHPCREENESDFFPWTVVGGVVVPVETEISSFAQILTQLGGEVPPTIIEEKVKEEDLRFSLADIPEKSLSPEFIEKFKTNLLPALKCEVEKIRKGELCDEQCLENYRKAFEKLIASKELLEANLQKFSQLGLFALFFPEFKSDSEKELFALLQLGRFPTLHFAVFHIISREYTCDGLTSSELESFKYWKAFSTQSGRFMKKIAGLNKHHDLIEFVSFMTHTISEGRENHVKEDSVLGAGVINDDHRILSSN